MDRNHLDDTCYHLFGGFVFLHCINSLAYTISALKFVSVSLLDFFNYKLFRGNRATKSFVGSFDAFGPPILPSLATITSSRMLVSWEFVHRPDPIKPFSTQIEPYPAHVACLLVFPGSSLRCSRPYSSCVGLCWTPSAVLTPLGGPNGSMTMNLAAVVKRRTVIVNFSQCKHVQSSVLKY